MRIGVLHVIRIHHPSLLHVLKECHTPLFGSEINDRNHGSGGKTKFHIQFINSSLLINTCASQIVRINFSIEIRSWHAQWNGTITYLISLTIDNLT